MTAGVPKTPNFDVFLCGETENTAQVFEKRSKIEVFENAACVFGASGA